MSTPNIFTYAKKELSQDAFICWLIACASEATGPLRKCGLAFVRALFRAGGLDGTRNIPVLNSAGCRMNPYNGRYYVSEVSSPRRQYLNIDVYFQAKVDGKKVSFIIEDKTDGQPGEGQLKGYLKSVIEDTEEKDIIKPVYFKTGYVFSEERDSVEQDKYSVFKAEDLKKFLDCHPDAIRENQILCQYSEYLNDKIKPRVEALKNWDFEQDYVQWEFLLKLRRVLRNADGEWQHFVPDRFSGEPDSGQPDEWKWNGLDRATPYGNPWTQYWFSQHLYWRIDSGWPLRLMISLANAEMNYDQDCDEIQEYRRLFGQALEPEELHAGNFLLVKAEKDCTIGSINIANIQKMTVSEFREFLDGVKRVHIRFLESISADM